MPLKYFEAQDIKKIALKIIKELNFFHIPPEAVYCYRSYGSKSKRIIARIHGFGKIWQKALNLPPAYVIEIISERFDKLTQEDKERTIIHELMHIPKGFKGGFRPHRGYVSRKQVEKLFKKYKKKSK